MEYEDSLSDFDCFNILSEFDCVLWVEWVIHYFTIIFCNINFYPNTFWSSIIIQY